MLKQVAFAVFEVAFETFAVRCNKII